MPVDQSGAVLHYVGYDVDRGGILAVIRALAAENQFPCLLGVNPEFQATRSRDLPLLRLPALAGDTIGARTALRAYRVARVVQTWLRADSRRVFHGHSRAGLLVALWLQKFGERRVVATVHCYGRQRWFYRWAARRLRDQIFWLSPAMKRHYALSDHTWKGCLPPCIPGGPWEHDDRRRETEIFRCGCVGGLVPVKQWELAVEALTHVPMDIPLRIVHAGSDDGTAESRRYADRLRSLAAQPNVAGRFELRGEVTDMTGFFREIDCLLIASGREAFSVAALEAARANVPTLAADAAGNRDLVEAARLGWLFTPDSPGDCAARLVELARGEAWKGWRRDEAALRRFTAPVVAAQHADVYRNLNHG